MTFSDEGVRWAKAQFSKFGSLHGFPDTEIGFTARAKALLRLAHPVVVCKRYAAERAFNEWEIGWAMLPPDQRKTAGPRPPKAVISDEDWAADWDQMEGATLEHHAFGRINPVVWLVERALDGARFCPTPADLGDLFVKEFNRADGARAEELNTFATSVREEVLD